MFNKMSAFYLIRDYIQKIIKELAQGFFNNKFLKLF